ncbi:MAG: carboxypeptidase-like regulatory domain-containing protein [Bacteroidetes bacterium]|nr:carboxypeptidase-like regulatory domain-containing protein [Bacteroidota bacterium]
MKSVLITIVALMFSFGGKLLADAPSHPLAPAKTVTLSGIVTDSRSGEALAGAQVEVEGTTMKTFTDFEGRFSLSVDANDALNLKVKYISYEEVQLKNLKPAAAKDVLQVKLQAK